MPAVEPTDDCLERLCRLEDTARRLARRLSQAEDPDARHQGSDPTGTVTVAVDNDGIVRDVGIRDAWRGYLLPRELDGAIKRAVTAAGVARLAAWGERVTPEPETPLSRTPLPLPSAVAEVLDRADALPAVTTIAERAQAVATRHHTGRSLDGHVNVTVNGVGAVLEVHSHLGWLAAATPENVTRETRQAFAAAYDLARPNGIDGLIGAVVRRQP